MKLTGLKIKVVTATIEFDEMPKEGWGYDLPKGFEYVVLAEYGDELRESYTIDAKRIAQVLTIDDDGKIGIL